VKRLNSKHFETLIWFNSDSSDSAFHEVVTPALIFNATAYIDDAPEDYANPIIRNVVVGSGVYLMVAPGEISEEIKGATS
jgi:hypothetical protein